MRKREPRQEAVVAAYARVSAAAWPGDDVEKALHHAHTVRLDSIQFSGSEFER